MSNAFARIATSPPMRPSPISPSVFPRTSAPDDDFSQRPSRIAASNFGTWRTKASNSANVCSATLTELPPGVLMTRTPRLVASSRSMLSTPTPARPTTRKCGALSISSGVTFVALRTINASASANSPDQRFLRGLDNLPTRRFQQLHATLAYLVGYDDFHLSSFRG